MSKKLIRALYFNKLRPADSSGFETENYNKFSEEFDKIYDEISELLPIENRGLLERLVNAQSSMNGEVAADAFAKGFALGLGFAAESLCEDK